MCFVDVTFVAQYMGGYSFGYVGPMLFSSQLCPFLAPLLGSTPSRLLTPQATS